MTDMVWKADTLYGDRFTARKLTAARGQYLIARDRDRGFYRVWHRHRDSVTGELPMRLVGRADTLEHAKVIAQADDDRRENEGAEVNVASEFWYICEYGPSDPSAVELEFEPSADKPKAIYVTLARVRIAVRGTNGWVALTPDYTVTDLDDFKGIYIQATGGHA
jgi:hypothetical protein